MNVSTYLFLVLKVWFLGHERYCGWVKADWPNQKIRSIKMLIFFVGSFWSHVVKAAEIIIMPFCLSLTNSVKYIFKPNENSHNIYFFVHRECYTKLWPIYDGLESWNIYLFFGQTWSVISLCQALFSNLTCQDRKKRFFYTENFILI